VSWTRLALGLRITTSSDWSGKADQTYAEALQTACCLADNSCRKGACMKGHRHPRLLGCCMLLMLLMVVTQATHKVWRRTCCMAPLVMVVLAYCSWLSKFARVMHSSCHAQYALCTMRCVYSLPAFTLVRCALFVAVESSCLMLVTFLVVCLLRCGLSCPPFFNAPPYACFASV
jgi:hypothetical protein